ncbi:MAG: META domain-containing protein [Ferruginibacter sp.]|nr:META domain-containing protein [Ferruginibacter sp.]
MKNIFISFSICLFAMACNSSKNGVQQKSNNNETLSSSNLQQTKTMLQSGIDFFAQGSQPANWQLTINYDDTVRFNADDGLTLKFAYNQLKKVFLPEKTIYTVKLKAGNVEINILDKICTVPTMREVFKKEVTVNFNSIIYTGCGKFLADDNLNSKWVLEKIGNTFINTNDYNKVPGIEFNLIEGKISGNDGCNNIGGKIEVQGKRIQFSSLFSTRMACNKKSIEKIITEQISGKMVSYYFKDSKLHLYLPDDSLLVFKKVSS